MKWTVLQIQIQKTRSELKKNYRTFGLFDSADKAQQFINGVSMDDCIDAIYKVVEFHPTRPGQI